MRPRRSKFGAIRTTVDGITFASKAEARRYSELKMLEKAGQVRNIRTQVPYKLNVSNFSIVTIGKYVADFVYEVPTVGAWGGPIVEDVKGFRTPLYRWKKKHFEAQYGIQILETGAK